jgi:hypothetical protein
MSWLRRSEYEIRAASDGTWTVHLCTADTAVCIASGCESNQEVAQARAIARMKELRQERKEQLEENSKTILLRFPE